MTPRRAPINIHPRVRESLALMLHGPNFEGTGIGYSAVVKAAVTLATEKGTAGAAFRDMIQQAQIEVTIFDGQDEAQRDIDRLVDEGFAHHMRPVSDPRGDA